MARIPDEFFELERKMLAVKPLDQYPDNHPDKMRLRLLVGMSMKEQRGIINGHYKRKKKVNTARLKSIPIKPEVIKQTLSDLGHTYRGVDEHVFGTIGCTGSIVNVGRSNVINIVKFCRAFNIEVEELIDEEWEVFEKLLDNDFVRKSLKL